MQWLDGQRPLAPLQSPPVFDKLITMQFRPCLYQPPRTPRHLARNQLHRIEPEDPDVIPAIGMKMRQVMRPADLEIHPDDDTEESAQLWHWAILCVFRRKMNGVSDGS